ncbi:hypothetical protein N201_08395 [Helicobacter pylori UM066]|nr:hypothetical protein N201_08395 [Helicobacter pylori UM066]
MFALVEFILKANPLGVSLLKHTSVKGVINKIKHEIKPSPKIYTS